MKVRNIRVKSGRNEYRVAFTLKPTRVLCVFRKTKHGETALALGGPTATYISNLARTELERADG